MSQPNTPVAPVPAPPVVPKPFVPPVPVVNPMTSAVARMHKATPAQLDAAVALASKIQAVKALGNATDINAVLDAAGVPAA